MSYEDLEKKNKKKNTKFQPPYLLNSNFIKNIFFLIFVFCKDQTISFSCQADKWQSILVSRCINFWLVFELDSNISQIIKGHHKIINATTKRLKPSTALHTPTNNATVGIKKHALTRKLPTEKQCTKPL